MDEESLTRIVNGALRACVKDHGSTVEGSWIGSATKRIVNQIMATQGEATRWVAAHEERKPDDHETVLLAASGGSTYRSGYWSGRQWFIHGKGPDDTVTHWMPITDGPPDTRNS